MGVWIETSLNSHCDFIDKSRPVWACGLKHGQAYLYIFLGRVAPRVGVWIETFVEIHSSQAVLVAPRVGVWIETCFFHNFSLERLVAPRVGVWIETYH